MEMLESEEKLPQIARKVPVADKRRFHGRMARPARRQFQGRMARPMVPAKAKNHKIPRQLNNINNPEMFMGRMARPSVPQNMGRVGAKKSVQQSKQVQQQQMPNMQNFQ